MDKPDPIQEMIDQLNQLVKLVQDKKLQFETEPLPEGLDQMLDNLESQVALFKEVTDETIKELGLSKEEIARKIESPSKKMKVDERRKARQLNHLKKDVVEIKQLLDLIAPKAQAELRKSKGNLSPKKKRQLKHKKRYKRMGGDEWKQV